MTLNGVIALTSPNRGVMSPNSVAFSTDYVKVVEDTLILSAAEMQAKTVVFLRYMIYCDIPGGYRERLRYGKSSIETLQVNSRRKLRKWRIANAKSRVDVGYRLRDCRTENIHTRNTLVIGFRLAILR